MISVMVLINAVDVSCLNLHRERPLLQCLQNQVTSLWSTKARTGLTVLVKPQRCPLVFRHKSIFHIIVPSVWSFH